jgi:AcrR family transcriptional regulator
MPKDTFWNLPDDKRKLIIDIAIDEFAGHDYRAASLSRIVRRAGIAKGSFYQYFDDKRDLYLYLIDLAVEARLAELRAGEALIAQQGFFEHLRWLIGASIRSALVNERLTQIATRAYSSNLPFEHDIIDRSRSIAADYFQRLIAHGIERGELATDLDPALISVTIVAMMNVAFEVSMQRQGIDRAALSEMDVHIYESSVVRETYDAVIRILEHGLGNRTHKPQVMLSGDAPEGRIA